MSILGETYDPAIAAQARPWRPGGMPLLPWSWPESTRVLLALVAMAAGLGLMAGRPGRPRATKREAASSDSKLEPKGAMLKLDPSRAMPEALAALPHIGPTLARRIVEAQADGPFRSPEDLRARVRGIGPVTLARITPYLQFESGSDAGSTGAEPGTVIADAGAKAGGPTASTTRKPPRSRKSKGSSVQLAAKGAVPTASP